MIWPRRRRRRGHRGTPPPDLGPERTGPAAGREVSTDAVLDRYGRHGVKVLGWSLDQPPWLVGLRTTDSRYHLHMPGTTGAGKSTLLANLVLQDAAAGRGAIVIDPKGDLIRDILDRLPATVAGRLVLIDPADTHAPPALNVLAGGDPWRTVDDLVAIFGRIFAAYWGPRTDDILRQSCLTLMRQPSATLADVPRLLTDDRFRAPLVHSVADDPNLRGFWHGHEAMSPSARASVAGPLLSKLRAILARPFVAGLYGTSQSSFDLTDVLDGGLLLARLPKGNLGEDTARLVGSILLAKVWHAVLGRASQPETERRDCTLIVDECQNFLGLASPVDDMLAEARGYRLSLVLAHQHFGQLGTELAHGISANAVNKICFRLEPDDAKAMARHLPGYTPDQLIGLPHHHAAVRLLADGHTQPAFTIATLPPAAPTDGRAGQLRRDAAKKYGIDPTDRHRNRVRRTRPAEEAVGVSAYVSGSASVSVPGDVLDTPTRTPSPDTASPQAKPGAAGKPPDRDSQED